MLYFLEERGWIIPIGLLPILMVAGIVSKPWTVGCEGTELVPGLWECPFKWQTLWAGILAIFAACLGLAATYWATQIAEQQRRKQRAIRANNVAYNLVPEIQRLTKFCRDKGNLVNNYQKKKDGEWLEIHIEALTMPETKMILDGWRDFESFSTWVQSDLADIRTLVTETKSLVANFLAPIERQKIDGSCKASVKMTPELRRTLRTISRHLAETRRVSGRVSTGLSFANLSPHE